MPQIATSDDQIEQCYAVLAQLRPHVARREFVARVREMQSEGYRLAYLEAGGQVVAVAGYRTMTNFFMGRHLYVEDLVTDDELRGQGYGRAMLDWLRAQAAADGCAFLDLDSGTQRGRAHRFYFAQGLSIVAYHFSVQLADS